MSGIRSDLCSFNVIEEEHVTTIDHTGVHMLNGRVFSTKRSLATTLWSLGQRGTRSPPHLLQQCRRWIYVNDLHCSLGHPHDAALRESSRQMGIKITGRSGYCKECAVGKGISKFAIKSTLCSAEKRLQRLYADLAGPMPVSAGGARYCLMVIDEATNMNWQGFVPKKKSATFTLGKTACLRTDNTSEIINNEFQRMMTDNHIRCEHYSIDGPKRTGRVKHELVLVAEGGVAPFWGFQTMFEGVLFPAKALNYDHM